MKSLLMKEEGIFMYNGDCLFFMDILIENGVKVDMVLTDPPYGTTSCSWDIIIPFDEMWKKIKSLRNDSTPVILFGSEPFSSMLRISNFKEYKYDWIWEKSKATGFLNSKKQPLRAYETISVFYKKQAKYNPQMSQGKPYNKGTRKKQTEDDVYGTFEQVEVKNSSGERYPRNVIYFKTAESEGGFHKSQKPVELLEYLIKTYTKEGDTVLDFTAGSFSTAVACINTNRRFIGIELDEKYFDIGVNRVKEALRIKEGV